MNKIKPNHGDIRYRTIFIWFPKYINGERYWLEFIDVKEKYIVGGILHDTWEGWEILNVDYTQKKLWHVGCVSYLKLAKRLCHMTFIVVKNMKKLSYKIRRLSVIKLLKEA